MTREGPGENRRSFNRGLRRKGGVGTGKGLVGETYPKLEYVQPLVEEYFPRELR